MTGTPSIPARPAKRPSNDINKLTVYVEERLSSQLSLRFYLGNANTMSEFGKSLHPEGRFRYIGTLSMTRQDADILLDRLNPDAVIQQ